MLQSMGSHGVGHGWEAELQQWRPQISEVSVS